MKLLVYFLIFFSLPVFAQNKTSLDVSIFANKLNNNPQAQLIDLRSANEFARGHLKKAQNINFNDDGFEDAVKTKLDRQQPVFLYCFSGWRSANAANYMRDLGFKQVYDLAGGFAKWTASSKPYVSASKTTEPIAAYTIENIQRIIQNNPLVLIDFYTDWNGPSKKMTPVINHLLESHPHIKLLKLDAEINDALAGVFQVEEIPTFIIFKKSKQVWRTSGEIPEDEFRDVLKRLK